MRKSIAALAAGLAVSATLVGGVADAATATPAAAAATCANYWVVVNTDTLSLRSGKGTNYSRVATVNRGQGMLCWPVELGGRYTACGHSNANGWIPIDRNGDGRIDAYGASACLIDG